jgi:GNAT superfamily N-acetyltransferase
MNGPAGETEPELALVSPWNVEIFAGFTFPHYRKEWQEGAPLIAMGASLAGEPVGLGLARLTQGGTHAEVLSLFVQPELRLKQIGTSLLRALEGALADKGVHVVTGTWTTGLPTTGALEHVVAKCGWAPSVARMLMFDAPLVDLQKAHWVQQASLSPGATLVPWHSLSGDDREALARWNQAEPWIPEDLEPWKHEEGCEPTTSLALFLDGRVVGWILTHALSPTTLRFSSGWVHPTMQRRGRLFALYAAAADRALAAGYDHCSWTVPMHHEAKVAFARRWMEPGSRCRESRGSVHLLPVLDGPDSRDDL